MNQIEDYEERKKLRRSRFWWRLLAVVAVICAGSVILSRVSGPSPVREPHVAYHLVEGVIVGDRDRTRLLREIGEDGAVRALVVGVNSPGGSVTGSEELYDVLREIAGEKPVVATMGDVAASGGYITALAADHILSMGNTITGSVGVIFQSPNVHELMGKVGVQMVEIKSGDLKAEPNPFKPVDPAVIAAERELVEDSFDWFLALVRERRGIGGDVLDEIGRGGIYTGRMALERDLIDGIGGTKDAREWLSSEHGIDADLPLVPYEVPEESEFPFGLLSGTWGPGETLEALGLGQRFGTGLWAIYR